MKYAMVIYSNDPETIWNAFRLANTLLGYDDEVNVFLLGKGVECMTTTSIKFNIKEQIDVFKEHGGKMVGCGICCDRREDEMPYIKQDLDCEMGSMQDLYTIINESDKVLTF